MYPLKVKEIAEERGFTMTSLAKKTDISFNTIKKMWRDPYYNVTAENLRRIAIALEVTVGALFEENNQQSGSEVEERLE
jgi:DNA-binding Xre family transcriptional regulator